MLKSKWIIITIIGIVLAIPLVYMYVVSLQFGFFGEWKELPAKELTEFSLQDEGGISQLTLPYTFNDKNPNDILILTTEIINSPSQRLYI